MAPSVTLRATRATTASGARRRRPSRPRVDQLTMVIAARRTPRVVVTLVWPRGGRKRTSRDDGSRRARREYGASSRDAAHRRTSRPPKGHRALAGRTAQDDRAVHLETGEEYPDGGDDVPRGRQRPEPSRTELAAHRGRHGQRPERRAPREERDATRPGCVCVPWLYVWKVAAPGPVLATPCRPNYVSAACGVSIPSFPVADRACDASRKLRHKAMRVTIAVRRRGVVRRSRGLHDRRVAPSGASPARGSSGATWRPASRQRPAREGKRRQGLRGVFFEDSRRVVRARAREMARRVPVVRRPRHAAR